MYFDNLILGIDDQWKAHFEHEFVQGYMQALGKFLEVEAECGQKVFPPKDQVFNAFQFSPLKKVKVVIVGQDPYHGFGQAHGLSFSVPDGVAIPPSLRNIYKEISRDIGMNMPIYGNLEGWAKQGVLLLNASLTVREADANSHSKKGWLAFTNSCIEKINQDQSGVVFLAWGKFAHNICANIDTSKHTVIKTSHPSPLGATKTGKDFVSFMGSGCFSNTNYYLKNYGKQTIDWDVL
ncbi:MAG: uracil-DNA glycosylase [Crocinitomicaceae bacterium]|jgi:uracil-DNA glycosylase